MMGSYNNLLNIYKDSKLAWTARTFTPIVFIETAKFENLAGLIVSLSDSGYLQVSFLGTEQLSLNLQAQVLQGSTKVDYRRINAEHEEILGRIR